MQQLRRHEGTSVVQYPGEGSKVSWRVGSQTRSRERDDEEVELQLDLNLVLNSAPLQLDLNLVLDSAPLQLDLNLVLDSAPLQLQYEPLYLQQVFVSEEISSRTIQVYGAKSRTKVLSLIWLHRGQGSFSPAQSWRDFC